MNGKKIWALAAGLVLAVLFSWNGQTALAAIALVVFGAVAASLAAVEANGRKSPVAEEKARWSEKELEALGKAREAVEAMQRLASDGLAPDADTPSWGELANLAGVKGFAPFARLGEGWVCEFAVKDGVAYEFEGVGEPDLTNQDEGLWIHGLIYSRSKDQRKWLDKAKTLKFLGEGEEDLPVGSPTPAQANRSARALAQSHSNGGAA